MHMHTLSHLQADPTTLMYRGRRIACDSCRPFLIEAPARPLPAMLLLSLVTIVGLTLLAVDVRESVETYDALAPALVVAVAKVAVEVEEAPKASATGGKGEMGAEEKPEAGTPSPRAIPGCDMGDTACTALERPPSLSSPSSTTRARPKSATTAVRLRRIRQLSDLRSRCITLGGTEGKYTSKTNKQNKSGYV